MTCTETIFALNFNRWGTDRPDDDVEMDESRVRALIIQMFSEARAHETMIIIIISRSANADAPFFFLSQPYLSRLIFILKLNTPVQVCR